METSSRNLLTTIRTNTITHLVRPSTSRQSYWQYFGFPADKSGTIINRQHIFCTLCNEFLVYNQNANHNKGDDLKLHLATVHPDIDEKMKITNELGGTVMITARQQKQQPQPVITVVSQPPQPPENLPTPSKSRNVPEYQNKRKSFQTSLADEDESIEYLIPEDEASSQVQNGHDDHEQYNETMAIDGEEYDPLEKSTNHDDDGDNVSASKTNKHHHTPKLEIFDYIDEIQQTNCKINEQIIDDVSDSSTAILDMFVQDLLPLTLIDGEGFRYFCQQRSNKLFTIQNSDQLEMELKELFINTQNIISQNIQTELYKKYFSIGCDRWTNYQKKDFLSFTINYEYLSLTEEYCKLKTLPLFTIQSDSLLSKSSLTLDSMFQHLNMNLCMGVIRNFSLDLEKPLKEFLDKHKIRSIECFALIINRIGAKIVKEIINPYILKIDNYLKMNQEKIKELNQVLTSPPPKIHSCFWITVHDYLNYFKDVCQTISTQTKNHNDDQMLNEISQIIALLAPFHMALTTMPEQKPLVSVILPLVQQLVQYQFVSHDDDTILNKQIKELVNNEFSKSFFSNTFLIMASFLDPRFHHLTNKDDLKQLKTDLQKLAPPDSTTISSPTILTPSSGSHIKTEPKKSTNSGLSYFFSKQSDGRSSLIKNSQTKFDIEFKSYLTIAQADIEQCPLQWWSDHQHIYSNLQFIVQRFNCLPAFITPNLHQPLKQQILLFNNRFMMNEDQPINEILWLHGLKYGDSSNQNICISDSKSVDVGDKVKKLNK